MGLEARAPSSLQFQLRIRPSTSVRTFPPGVEHRAPESLGDISMCGQVTGTCMYVSWNLPLSAYSQRSALLRLDALQQFSLSHIDEQRSAVAAAVAAAAVAAGPGAEETARQIIPTTSRQSDGLTIIIITTTIQTYRTRARKHTHSIHCFSSLSLCLSATLPLPPISLPPSPTTTTTTTTEQLSPPPPLSSALPRTVFFLLVLRPSLPFPRNFHLTLASLAPPGPSFAGLAQVNACAYSFSSRDPIQSANNPIQIHPSIPPARLFAVRLPPPLPPHNTCYIHLGHGYTPPPPSALLLTGQQTYPPPRE